MRKLIIFSTLILTFFSCVNTKIITPKESSKEYNGRLFFPTYDENNFPKDTIRNGASDSLSLFVNKWYSKHLNSLQEKPIYNRINENINIIRFTNLGTWSNPFTYRIEQQNGKFTKIYKQTNGLGGYQTGKIIKNNEEFISELEWNLILSKANEINFWNINTHDPNYILDGEEWILEMLIDGKYHLVYRNSPENYDGNKFAELCKLIIK